MVSNGDALAIGSGITTLDLMTVAFAAAGLFIVADSVNWAPGTILHLQMLAQEQHMTVRDLVAANAEARTQLIGLLLKLAIGFLLLFAPRGLAGLLVRPRQPEESESEDAES
jgi:hypothetical protein